MCVFFFFFFFFLTKIDGGASEHITALFELSTNNHFVYFIRLRLIFKLTDVKP